MPRDPDINRYQARLQLSASQVLVMDALDDGATHAEADQVAGVNRVTVIRWVHHHNRGESTHLRKEIEKNDIALCTYCGVEPCNCHDGWSQSRKGSGLREIWEPGGETNGWTTPSR
jgi:hypothetical protein